MGNVVVTTIKKDSNELFYQTKKADLVSVRVEETAIGIDANGFMRKEVRSDFVKLPKALAEEMVANGILKAGVPLKNITGQESKIKIVESHTPFYEGQEPKINPTTGEIVLSGGQPVYRRGMLTTNLSEGDTLLVSDKTTVNATVQPNTDFAKSKA